MTKCDFLVGVTKEARALLKRFCRPCREKEKNTEILVNTILETKNKRQTINQELRGLLMEECRLNGEMMDEGFSEDFEIGMELGYNQACSNENAKIKKRLEK